jgi:hypothetical protein
MPARNSCFSFARGKPRPAHRVTRIRCPDGLSTASTWSQMLLNITLVNRMHHGTPHAPQPHAGCCRPQTHAPIVKAGPTQHMQHYTLHAHACTHWQHGVKTHARLRAQQHTIPQNPRRPHAVQLYQPQMLICSSDALPSLALCWLLAPSHKRSAHQFTDPSCSCCTVHGKRTGSTPALVSDNLQLRPPYDTRHTPCASR